MRLSRPLFLTYFLLFLVGSFIVYLIIRDKSPEGAAWYYFLGFYTAIFLSVFGLVAMANSIIRLIFGRAFASFQSYSAVTRQSGELALLFTACLLIQSFRLLNIYIAVLVAGVILSLEFYFSSSSVK